MMYIMVFVGLFGIVAADDQDCTMSGDKSIYFCCGEGNQFRASDILHGGEESGIIRCCKNFPQASFYCVTACVDGSLDPDDPADCSSDSASKASLAASLDDRSFVAGNQANLPMCFVAAAFGGMLGATIVFMSRRLMGKSSQQGYAELVG